MAGDEVPSTPLAPLPASMPPLAPALRVGLLVPTCNAGPRWADWLRGLRQQTRAPDAVLVIDSTSDDATVALAQAAGLPVQRIARADFDHGGTRQWGVEQLATGGGFAGGAVAGGAVACDVVVCMTQDALLTDAHALECLLAAFADPQVGLAWGRQRPHDGANPLAAHARQFNYPPQSRVVSWADRATLGMKVAFCSNAFAAWRVTALQQAGGFPRHVVLGEDMLAAARLLQCGWRSAYVAEAQVQHSHDYAWPEELRRYFDTGALHASQPWLLQALGGAGREGWRFIRSEQRALAGVAPCSERWYWRCRAGVQTLAKWVGYRLGRSYRHLPLSLRRALSMHPGWWA